MEYSKNFNFALPSRDNDVDLADINEISNNFRKIDENSVKKEVGKGLSTNDFTDEYKSKVENALTSENIDSEMSDTSENTVQNKVVKKYADDKIKYRIINDITITEDISVFSTSQDDNGNAFDLQKFFFLFIGKFDAALSNKPLSLSVKKGIQYLMYKNFTVAADKECSFWLEGDNFLRTSSASGIKSTYSGDFLRQFSNGTAQGLKDNNKAVDSDISLVPVVLSSPAAINELRFSVHDQTIKMKKGSRFILLGIDYNA